MSGVAGGVERMLSREDPFAPLRSSVRHEGRPKSAHALEKPFPAEDASTISFEAPPPEPPERRLLPLPEEPLEGGERYSALPGLRRVYCGVA